jgi:hypothetical protein
MSHAEAAARGSSQPGSRRLNKAGGKLERIELLNRRFRAIQKLTRAVLAPAEGTLSFFED